MSQRRFPRHLLPPRLRSKLRMVATDLHSIDLNGIDPLEKEVRMTEALKDVLYESIRNGEYCVIAPDWDTANPERDFHLQFSALKWNEHQKEWKVKCCLPCSPNHIYDAGEVEYSNDDATYVILKSWKHNWDKFHWDGTPHREWEDDEIPLHTLYSDFEFHEYRGKCWML